MPAVSDTSPILGLSAIGLLDLLQQQFATIYIPQAVLEELKLETDFRGTNSTQQALRSGGLEAREVQNKPLAQALAVDLDKGESELPWLSILGFK
jgi:predicted nucleic acid-binding protein